MLLKTTDDKPFISSDNPGFSVNINETGVDFHSLTPSFAINADATNFFILSPKYCLEISPFYQGTPVEVNINNQEIKFKECDNTLYDFINFCTMHTFKKYLISNNEQILQKVKTFLTNAEEKGNKNKPTPE